VTTRNSVCLAIAKYYTEEVTWYSVGVRFEYRRGTGSCLSSPPPDKFRIVGNILCPNTFLPYPYQFTVKSLHHSTLQPLRTSSHTLYTASLYTYYLMFL